MDYQLIINIGFAVILFLAGWLMRIFWETLKEHETKHGSLTNKVAEIEVLVAGQYVKKEHMDQMMGRMFEKLDRIEDKIDKKADKK